MKPSRPKNIWTQEELKLIEAIKPYKSLYTVPICTLDHLLYKKQSGKVWDDLASQLGMPVQKIRNIWGRMKFEYKKVLMKPKKRSKLLDGTLDFLKPWATHSINVNKIKEKNKYKRNHDEAMELSSTPSTEEDNDSDGDATMTPPLENIEHLKVEENSEREIETTEPSTSYSSQYAVNNKEHVLSGVNNDVVYVPSNILSSEEDSESDGDATMTPPLENIEHLNIEESSERVIETTDPLTFCNNQYAVNYKEQVLRGVNNDVVYVPSNIQSSEEDSDGDAKMTPPLENIEHLNIEESSERVIETTEPSTSYSSQYAVSNKEHVLSGVNNDVVYVPSNILSSEEDSDGDATMTPPLENIEHLNREENSERDIETTDPLTSCNNQYAVNYEEGVLSDVNNDVANVNVQSILKNKPNFTPHETKHSKKGKEWTQENLAFVNAVKRHKSLYTVALCHSDRVLYKSEAPMAWEAIASELGIPVMKVRQKWKGFKDRYKLAFMNSKDSMLLDGTLDFLKPWVSYYINLHKKTNIVNFKILTTKEDNDSDSEATMTPPLENNLTIEVNSESDIETTEPSTSSTSQYAVNNKEQIKHHSVLIFEPHANRMKNFKIAGTIWMQEELLLIEAIKPHKSLYTVPTCTSDRVLLKRESAMAWKVIASQLGMPEMKLRQEWSRIRRRYKDALVNSRYYSKLLDGTLDFLKPWTNHYINLTKKSNDEINDDKEMEPTPSTKEDNDSDSGATMTPPLENNLTIEINSESDIETTEPLTSSSSQYAVNNKEHVLSGVNKDVRNVNDSSILRKILREQKKKEICEVTENHEKAHDSDLLSDFFARYDNNSDNNNLMEYFRDLAEVLCCKLAPTKRTNFLSQIDLIVSQILIDKNEDIANI